MDHPDYSKLHTIEECEQIADTARREIEDLVREHSKVAADRAARNAEFSAHLKAIEKRQDHTLGVIDALNNRRGEIERQPDLFSRVKVESDVRKADAGEAVVVPAQDGTVLPGEEAFQQPPIEAGDAPQLPPHVEPVALVQDRITERRLADGMWQLCQFEELRTGDVFRLFESDGTPVDGGEVAQAATDAAQDAAGVWFVQATRGEPQSVPSASAMTTGDPELDAQLEGQDASDLPVPPPADDGSLPFNDGEIAQLLAGNELGAIDDYRIRTSCTKEIAEAEVAAWRAAQQEQPAAADPAPPAVEEPKRRRRRPNAGVAS